MKASDNLVGFLDDDRSPFVKTGNHSLKAASFLFGSIMMTWTGAANAVMILFSITIVTVYNKSKKIN